MTVSREIVETPAAESAAQSLWIRPAVSRLVAGKAELLGSNAGDGEATQS